jgi:hypothetical protein
MTATQRDTPLNFDRKATSKAAHAMGSYFAERLLAYEKHAGLRTRARKLADQEIFEEQVKVIVYNLIFNHLKPLKNRSGWLSVSLSHRLHGRHPLQNSTLVKTLELFEAIEFIHLEKGKIGTGLQTRLCLTEKAKEWLEPHQFKVEDFRSVKSKPLIQLRSPKNEKKKYKLLEVDYDDSVIRRYLEQVQLLNAHYESADILYHADDGTDDTNRFVYRVFTEGSYESCGRLYGGFWQSQGVSHQRRRAFMTIGNERVACLDFGQSAIRLAYAEAGAVPPMTDLYAIPGYERHRDICKTFINMLFNKEEAIRLRYRPKALTKNAIDPDRAIAHFRSAIYKFHSPIAHLFKKAIGQRLMFKESQIVIDSLITMTNKGITALPVGDGVYVQESMVDEALSILKKTYVQQCGFEPMISIER